MASEHPNRRGRRAGHRKLEAMTKVVGMRDMGASFREIGAELGISHTYAFKLYRSALDEMAAELDAVRDKHVVAELRRIDRLILAQWPSRYEPQAAGVILRCIEMKAKLLGLHAPVKVEHGGTIEHEDAAERRRRILAETADAVARMTPEQLAAEAASLLGGDE